MSGEYRMGDNDTRTDAKRLALLDAKRLALEQAGTYLEGITEVRNLTLSKEEIRAYTAGIVEVVEQSTKDTVEGATHIVRVDVAARIDTDVVTRHVAALQKNEAAKRELLRLRTEVHQLQGELTDLKFRLQSSQPGPNSALLQRRNQIANRLEANALLVRAQNYLNPFRESRNFNGPIQAPEYSEARALARQALDIDPENAQAHFTLGYIDWIQGHYDEAVKELRNATRISRDNWKYHHYFGLALRDQGNFPIAITELKEAVFLEHDSSFAKRLNIDLPSTPLEGLISAHFEYARQQAKEGNIDAAIGEYYEVLKLRADHYGALVFLGESLTQKKELDGAIKHLQQAVAVYPEGGAAHFGLAQALSQQGHSSRAIHEYQEAIRLAAGSSIVVHAHNNIGLILEESEDLEGALSAYQTALRLKPEDPVLLENIRRVQARFPNAK